MKSIKEKSKDWCSNHSNKGCTEQCEGCWQVKTAFGCEQHNMGLAYEAGANYVLEEIEKCVKSSSNSRLKIDTIKQIIEQLKK